MHLESKQLENRKSKNLKGYRDMKESKRYDFRRDGYTLQVIHTNSKYNKDKILKYLICEHYLLNNADSFRIFLRIQHIYCSLGISLIVPQGLATIFFSLYS